MNNIYNSFSKPPLYKGVLLKKLGLTSFLLAFMFLGTANATAWLTIKNTGCQPMKVYKKSLLFETFQTTLNPNASWTTLTLWGEEWVYRKTDGTWLGSYTATTAFTQTDNFNSGGGPTAPVVGTITQPTCTSSTGSVVLSGLPSTGTWTLKRTPGNVTTTGTGASFTLTGLAAGTYTFTVTNSTGCTSGSCSNIVINNPPNAPTAPTIGTMTQPNCTNNTGSVVVSGLPSAGTWTLTRTPGNVTNTGTGSTYTVSGIPVGTFSFTVKNAAGCTSGSSASFTLSLQTQAPGTACNDFNTSTTNDVIQADGCTCAGTPTNNGPNCATGINITTGSGSINVTGLNLAPVSSLQVFSTNWQQMYSCFANCGASQTVTVPSGNYYVYAKYYTAGYALICEKTLTVTVTSTAPCANQGGDTDGDGVCNNVDCQPNNAALPATPGTPCNDANANTTNDVIQPDGCSCAGTPINACNNLTSGGTIGFGSTCASATTVCNTAAPTITNCTAPNGGSGTLETVWLKSTTSCSAPTTSAASIMAGLDPHWKVIAGATGLTYDPGTVSASTCYLRCSRRVGCDTYVESNIISLTVNCNGNGTPDCANISITTGAGNISVTGLSGAPISSLQVFSSTWQSMYNCFANCGASQTVTVPAGTYYVYAKYYTAGYALICEKQQTVTVSATSPCANQGGDTDGDGVCNNVDCQPNNAALPATPGTACNDANANTINDVIQADGCSCAGTPIAIGTLLPPATHPKFVNQLPNIPRINATAGGTYNITMDESMQDLGIVDNLGNHLQTKVWGYTYNGAKMYLGPTFVTMKNVPVDVKWMNNLPNIHGHLLPLDHTIHMAHPTIGIPTVAHLHGGHTEAESDGYPESWFTNGFAELGPSWSKPTYHYALDQEATNLWYHDHALGITRLNVYAGLAGIWLHRDQNELSMNLPSGAYERELVLQDKMFSADGQLFFPSDPGDPLLPNPSILPEFFGDYIVVNGKVWPVLDVAPTKYRFRLVNACDSRVLLLKLSNGASFQQIGSDGGLLNSPVTLTQLLIAPGERADLIVDFSTMNGQQIILQNLGPDGPFQGFDPITGDVLGGPSDPATTGQMMMFRVNQPAGAVFNVPNTLRQPIQSLGTAQNTRQVLLYEGVDDYGRILPSLGTVSQGQLGWLDPITEMPEVGKTEIWEIYNTTMDAHPIHLHQVFFEIIDRQEFMADQDPVTGALSNIMMMGTPQTPAANELGWKDTGVNYPMTRTRYRVRFDIPGRFVWHCHILSHEDHDMMRPLDVVPAGSGGGGGSGNSTPNCANISIMTSPGNIMVHGLDGAPVTSLQIFSNTWQPVYSCFGDCGATKTVTVGPGSFYVYVKYYNASYGLVCEVNQTVSVPNVLMGFQGEQFKLYPNQYEEHAEIMWTHNAGELVNVYELERSTDGIAFESLEKLASKGGHAKESYTSFDFEPAAGDDFYRVKMYLSDGTTTYSEIVRLTYTQVENFTLFPNPANQFVKMNLSPFVGLENAEIKIFNDLGVMMKRFELEEISSKYFQMDIRDLKEGHYTVWLNVPGKRPIARQLVVGKV